MESLQQHTTMSYMASSSPMVHKPSSSDTGPNYNSQLRSIKMDFSYFDDSQALQWIYQVE